MRQKEEAVNLVLLLLLLWSKLGSKSCPPLWLPVIQTVLAEVVCAGIS